MKFKFKDWRTTLVGLLFAGASIASSEEIDLNAIINAAAMGALGAVAGDSTKGAPAGTEEDPLSVVPKPAKKPAKKK